MLPKLHRAQIQRTILAVEQIDIPVKGLHRNGEHRLGVLDHGFSVFTELQLLDPLDEPLAGILLGDGQGEQIQLVRQQLRQLRDLEVFHIRLPDSPVVDIPDATLTVVPCNGLEVIGEGVAHADLLSAISGIRVRCHLLKGQGDARDVRLELDGLVLVQIGELLVHNILGIDRDVHRGCRIHRIADGDRTVGRAGLLTIPLGSHEAGRTEDAVHLLLITAAPEREDRQQRHVGVGLAVVQLLPVTGVERLELLPACGFLRVFDDGVIVQIGVVAHLCVLHLLCPLHQRVQQGGHGGLVVGDFPFRLTCAVNIPRHGDEAVCRAGHIDFQTSPAVVDVVDCLIENVVLRHTEEAAQSFTGRGAFHVSRRKDGEDGRRRVVQRPVLPDALVDVEGTDAISDRNADAIVTAHCVGNQSGLEVGKGVRVIDLRPVPVRWVIGHLGFLAIAFFELPYAEAAGALQQCRDILDIYHAGSSLWSGASALKDVSAS